MKKFFVFLSLLFTITFVNAKAEPGQFFKDEMTKFHFGVGVNVNTSSLLGIYYNALLYQADKQGGTFNLPGLTYQDVAKYKELNESMKTGILISNILGTLEYGLKFRFMWNILIAEADLNLLPMEGTYNGKLDFSVNMGVGVRLPFWIMPYIMVGPLFTFSFYPDEFIKVESWKSNWGGVGNFLFRPGLSIKAGLDFKFKTFSIGAYYSYSIKDFDEFTKFYNVIIAGNIGDSDAEKTEAIGMVFGKQSKFGIVLVIYPEGFIKK